MFNNIFPLHTKMHTFHLKYPNVLQPTNQPTNQPASPPRPVGPGKFGG